MSTTTAAPAARSIAEDTLAQKRRDGSVISGGHLVAKARTAAGVDRIFTASGGHGSARRG